MIRGSVHMPWRGKMIKECAMTGANMFSLAPFLYISCHPPNKQTGRQAYPNRPRRRRSKERGIPNPLLNLRFLLNRSQHLQQPTQETPRNHPDRIRPSTTSLTLTPTLILTRPCRILCHLTLILRSFFRKDRFRLQNSLTNQRNSTTKRINHLKVNLPPRHSPCHSRSTIRHLAVTPRTELLAGSTLPTRI